MTTEEFIRFLSTLPPDAIVVEQASGSFSTEAEASFIRVQEMHQAPHGQWYPCVKDLWECHGCKSQFPLKTVVRL